MGIGTLLEDGLGDTIRVSLTEAPEEEIPVARLLAERYTSRPHEPLRPAPVMIDPFEHSRRHAHLVLNIGDKQVPRVVADLSHRSEIVPATLFSVGYQYSVPLDKWNITDMACDFVYCGKLNVDFEIPGTLGLLFDHSVWMQNPHRERCFPVLTVEEYQSGLLLDGTLNFIRADRDQLTLALISKLKTDRTAVLVLETRHSHGMAEQRAAFFELISSECVVPVIIKRSYDTADEDPFMLYSATDTGALLIDGLGDGIWLSAPAISPQKVNNTAFGILQATRTRISKTEYISCPSCGRTLFDLQETTAKIRSRTSHLKGIKIGIMGCIVNGPGEMADADYGYVGTGQGKITLYKEKNVVKKNIPEERAVDELIELIREHGDWVEKEI